MAWPSWVLGAIRAFRGRAVLVLYLPPPEGESETWRRAQRLKAQPVRAGRRPPRSGALEQASTSPTLHRPSGPVVDGQIRGKSPDGSRLTAAGMSGSGACAPEARRHSESPAALELRRTDGEQANACSCRFAS